MARLKASNHQVNLTSMAERTTFIPDLLRAARPGSTSAVHLAPDQAIALCRLGLGPLAWTLRANGRLSASNDSLELLQGADLTSRLLHGRTSRAVSDLLAEFSQRQIRVTLLKGISIADQYYDPPWCRIMGDVDLLVADQDLAEAASMIESFGYVPDEAETLELPHHHLPAVRNPDSGVIIELHSELFRPNSPPSRCSLFSSGRWREYTAPSHFGDEGAQRFAPEYQLAYTIAHWATERKWPTNVFAYADCALIVAASGHFDWSRFVRWMHDCEWFGAVATIMLSCLAAHDLLQPAPPVVDAMRSYRRRLGGHNVDFMRQLVTTIPLSGGLHGRKWLDDSRGRTLWRHMLEPGDQFMSRKAASSRVIRDEFRRRLQSLRRLGRELVVNLQSRL